MFYELEPALTLLAKSEGQDTLINDQQRVLGIMNDSVEGKEAQKELSILKEFYKHKIHRIFADCAVVSQTQIDSAVELLEDESVIGRDNAKRIVRISVRPYRRLRVILKL